MRRRALLIAAAYRADSFAERTFVAVLRDAGIDGRVLHLPLGSRSHIDVAFPEAKVAIEVDGRTWHVDVDRFRADRVKQNVLVQAGWLPLRFTWHDLTRRPRPWSVTSAARSATMITTSAGPASTCEAASARIVIFGCLSGAGGRCGPR